MNRHILILSLIIFLIPTSAQTADFNNDGKVDFIDFLKFANAFGSTDAQYDLNQNGHVDFLDFTSFVAQYQQFSTPTVRPTYNTVLNTLDKNHPRLMLKNDRLAQLKTQWETDPALKKIVSDVMAEANRLLTKSPLKYELIGPRLLSVSREALDRLYHFGIAYRWTGEQKYLDGAKSVMFTVVAFPNWNPSHFLDVAEMTHAVGIGYDWLYHALDEQSRTTIKTGLIKHGLIPGREAYENKPLWWVDSKFNWNQVCNGGLIVGALAVAETDPLYAQNIIPNACLSLPTAIKTYNPDGAWGEGPGYWNYATSYTAYGLSALQTALGTTFGLTNANGLSKAAYFPLHATGPTDYYFNYADVGEKAKRGPMPCNFYLASAYSDNFIAAAEHQMLKSKQADPQHIMWYVPEPNLQLNPERDRLFRGEVDVAFMRSTWNDPNAVFAGIKAGYNLVNHGHLDLGNFIVDALGVRWASDLGSDNYDLPGYFSTNGQRWTYYRLISESHNVPLINGKGQAPPGTSAITRFRSDGVFPFAQIDLSKAYADVEATITRGLALINDRQDILIQDEFNLQKPAFITWGMTTEATINLQNDGSALLSRNHQQLRAIVLSPKGWAFGIESAQQAAPQQTNKGYNRLVIRPVYETAQLTVAVLLSPVTATERPTPEVVSITQW